MTPRAAETIVAGAIFANTVQKAHLWLSELMEELGWQDTQKTFTALKATLHALRDRLTVEEAVQLGAQMPTLIRGMYYEGWTTRDKPLKERRREEFLAHVRQSFRRDPAVDPEAAVRAVFKLLSRRISEGEIEDVKNILPQELRGLWP
jgi:uncharacterized protein (DUF2267 family)